MAPCAFLLVLASAASVAVSLPAPDFSVGARVAPDVVAVPGRRGDCAVQRWSTVWEVPKGNGSVTAFIGMTPSVSCFSFREPPTGCGGKRAATSESARFHGCEYATNAGFFSFTAQYFCLGNVIVNGTVGTLADHPTATFAVTDDAVLVGFMNSSVVQAGGQAYRPRDAVSGVGWLVRDGKPYAERSPDLNPTSTFFLEYAPRTAVGVFANGSIALVEVDGEEDIDLGMGLGEFADALAGMGFLHVINLDGGGSSTSAYRGQVISKPTCMDTPLICERAVSTIACISAAPL